jgi:putative transposase
MERQKEFVFPTWGGKREGAGRKPKGERAGVTHLKRPVLAARFPVHVTWRMEKGVWNLRTRRCFSVLQRAMYAGAARFGFRLVHYAVMGNHVHLMVEAPDRVALGRAMKGLGVRVAKGLNRVMGRLGKVLGDRFHGRILRTPTEVNRVRVYLLTNAEKHFAEREPDPYCSRVAVVEPRTFLMRRVC